MPVRPEGTCASLPEEKMGGKMTASLRHRPSNGVANTEINLSRHCRDAFDLARDYGRCMTAVTLWSKPASNGSTLRRITPVAPVRKIRILAVLKRRRLRASAKDDAGSTRDRKGVREIGKAADEGTAESRGRSEAA